MSLPDQIPLVPEPIPKIWAGSTLRDWCGADEPIGELWLASGRTVVSDGPLAGRTLDDLCAEYGQELLGSIGMRSVNGLFPLIIKIIDAGEWLSLQVHPDDDYAAQVAADSGYRGKLETWHLLATHPDAQVAYGFVQPLSAEQFKLAAADGSIMDLVQKIAVRKGDTLTVTPGTVHSIGPGCLLYEVQTRSDITYRIYDFDRDRDLHLDDALNVAELGSGAPRVPIRGQGGDGDLIVQTGEYEVWFQTIHSGQPASAPLDSPVVACRLESDVVADVLMIPAGASSVIPDGRWIMAAAVDSDRIPAE